MFKLMRKVSKRRLKTTNEENGPQKLPNPSSPTSSLSLFLNNESMVACSQYSTQSFTAPTSSPSPEQTQDSEDSGKNVELVKQRSKGEGAPMSGEVLLPPLREGEYEILWDEGPLGIRLGFDKDLGVTVVRGLTGTNQAPFPRPVRPGDILVYLNEKSMTQLTLEQCRDALSSVKRPCVVRFLSIASGSRILARSETIRMPENDPAQRERSFSGRTPSPVSCDPPRPSGSFAGDRDRESREFEIVWRTGQLGISIRRDPLFDVPVVARVAVKENPQLNALYPGDLLIAVNGQSTARQSISQTLKSIVSGAKPVILRFQRGGVSVPSLPQATVSQPQCFPPPRLSIEGLRNSMGGTSSMIEETESRIRSLSRSETLETERKSMFSVDGYSPRRSLTIGGGEGGSPGSRSDYRTRRSQSMGCSPRSLAVAEKGERRLERQATSVASEDYFRDYAKRVRLPELGPNEYEVLWEDGPLGLSFRKNQSTGRPHIAKVSNSEVNARRPVRCSVGDELVFVNEQDTGILGFKGSVDFLMWMPKPVVLRFRSTESVLSLSLERLGPFPICCDPPGVTRVLWHTGPLGMTLTRSTDSSCPVISGISRSRTHLPSTVFPGDYLLSINGIHTFELDFHDVVTLLRSLQKPILLRIRSADIDKDKIVEEEETEAEAETSLTEGIGEERTSSNDEQEEDETTSPSSSTHEEAPSASRTSLEEADTAKPAVLKSRSTSTLSHTGSMFSSGPESPPLVTKGAGEPLDADSLNPVKEGDELPSPVAEIPLLEQDEESLPAPSTSVVADLIPTLSVNTLAQEIEIVAASQSLPPCPLPALAVEQPVYVS